MRSDEEILQGFLDGDSQAFRELLIRFQKPFLKKLWLHHRGLWSRRADILDAAETRLLEWRRKHREGELRFHPAESIRELAWRIAKQEAELEGAFLERQEDAKEKEAARLRSPRADDGVRYLDLLREIEGLPAEMSEVLMAEAERSENGGPSLAEALGISEAAARKRLERARRELKQRLGRSLAAEGGHHYWGAAEEAGRKDDDNEEE